MFDCNLSFFFFKTFLSKKLINFFFLKTFKELLNNSPMDAIGNKENVSLWRTNNKSTNNQIFNHAYA